MFAKLKAWAAALWLAIKFELAGGREIQLMNQLEHALDREERYKDQAERWQALFESKCDEIREIVKASDDCVRLRDKAIAAHEAECRRLNVIRKGLEEDAAILVRRQKEDAAKIERLEGQVKSSANLVKMLEESHVKANKEILQLREQKEYDAKTHELLAAERDKHDRRAAEFQTQCKRMTLELEASRAIIAGTKIAEGELLIVNVTQNGEQREQVLDAIQAAELGGKVVVLADGINAWKATPISTPGNTSATDPAPEPEIAITEKLSSIHEASEVIQSLLIEMHPGMPPSWWQKCMSESSPVSRALKWLHLHVNSGNIDKVRASLVPTANYATGDGATPPPSFGEVDPVDEVLASHIGDVLTEMNRGRLAAIEGELGEGMQPSPEQLADEARQYQQAAKLWPNGPKG